MEKPNIYLFNYNNSYYFYDVNKNSIVETSKDAYEYLTLGCVKSKDIDEEIEKLKIEGFLLCNKPRFIEHPCTAEVKELLNSNINRVCLQITQSCNLRCKYCVYSGLYNNRIHTNSEMGFDVAKKAIDFLVDHSSNNDLVDIGFYGGEPLLRYSFIEKCIDYALNVCEGKTVSFSITTNGTLLTEKMIERFIESNVELTISLDGPRSVHNRNRILKNGEGSFDLLMSKIEMIKKQYPEYADEISYNMVIDQRSTDLDEIISFVANSKVIENNYITATTIATDGSKEPIFSCREFRESNRYGEFRYMLSLLNRISQNCPDLKLWRGSFKKLEQFARDTRKNSRILGEKEHHSGPCIPGQLRLFVNTNGDFYPCERVSESSKEMVIGNVESGFDYKKIIKLLNIGMLTEGECKNCYAIRNCTICSASADDNGILSRNVKLRACEESRYSFSEMLLDLCALNKAGFSIDD